jgi:hypothetical protein
LEIVIKYTKSSAQLARRAENRNRSADTLLRAILNDPSSNQETKQEVQQLLSELETALAPSELEAAQTCEPGTDFKVLVEKILAEIE